MTPPLVSVKVATYNHEPYLGQCLEGILAQKTDFPFEVVVGEDCSTDGTRAIAESYAQAHPAVVRLVAADANVGPARNLARIRAACRGRYEALCEGDDFWIHPLKLQRQVEFLEAHADCGFCFHDVLQFQEDKDARPRFYCPRDLPDFPSVADVLRWPQFIATCSVLARREFLETLPAWRTGLLCGDLVVRLWGPHVGRIGYLPDVMAVQRNHAGGMNTMLGHRRMVESAIQAYRRFDEATGGRYAREIRDRIRFEQQYIRFGPLAYLLHPAKAAARIKRGFSGAGL